MERTKHTTAKMTPKNPAYNQTIAIPAAIAAQRPFTKISYRVVGVSAGAWTRDNRETINVWPGTPVGW